MTTAQITLATTLTIQSAILLWYTTKYIIEKKQIAPYIPFIIAGIAMALGASVGFGTELSLAMSIIIKGSLLITTILITINTRRTQWK